MKLFESGAAYMVTSAFSFSIMGLLVKTAGQRIPSQELVFFRNVMTLALTWMMLRGARVAPWGTHRGPLALRGFFGFVALSGFYFGVTHLPMAEATVIQYTNPVLTALFAALMLGEPIRASLVLSTAASLTGVILVARPAFLGFGGHGLDPWHVAVAFGGALASALAYVLVRWLGSREHALVIVWYFPVVALPASLPGLTHGAIWPQGWDWALLLGVGLSTQVGQVAMTRGISLLPAGTATAISYLQVAFATLWGWAFFGEIPSSYTWIGAALVVVGTFAVAFTAPPPVVASPPDAAPPTP